MDPTKVAGLSPQLTKPSPPLVPADPKASVENLGVPCGSSCNKDGGLVCRRAPEPIVVGEIRQNLDDLKAAVLSHYSRLYSLAGRSIDERLDRLAAPPFSSTVKTGRLPLATSAQHRPKTQPGVAVPPPYTCFDFLAEEQKGPKDAKDANQVAKQGDPEAQKTFYGMAQLPGQKAGSGMKGYDNLLGHRLDETRGGQINELLGDLRLKCAAATRRLNTIGDQLDREREDPNLREWEFTTYPEARRHPNLGSDPDLRRHLLTLYQDLAHQSQANQLKINAIQGKLKVLNLHTKSDMIKLKSDPRIAF